MKILHLNNSDTDGGAAKGAFWLHTALKDAGADSKMLVARKRTDDDAVIGLSGAIQKSVYLFRSEVLDGLPLQRYKQRTSDFFSTCYSPIPLPDGIKQQVSKINPDIINLHWICHGFLPPEMFSQLKQPIVWTLRDMWGFTGGCTYTGNCSRYEHSCGQCPQLGSGSESDISRILWKRKQHSWRDANLTIVTISHWLADCARRSSLFRDRQIEVIHNAVDISVFRPICKSHAREILGLPQDKNLILFGAISATKDLRKGFQYLAPALKNLGKAGLCTSTELLIFGSSRPKEPVELGIPIRYMGKLNDEITLALLYSAANVMVVPSVQEAFGKTAIEALACGTPVVSFDSTGLKDIVEHRKNGYRAKCFDSDDLAKGIAWVLQDIDRWRLLSYRARQKVEQEFSLEIQANAYLKLYQSILDSTI